MAGGMHAKGVTHGGNDRHPVYTGSVGYLPVANLQCLSGGKLEAIGLNLFHACMRKLFETLVSAGRKGVSMECADNKTRHVHPLLSAYVADRQECSSPITVDNTKSNQISNETN